MHVMHMQIWSITTVKETVRLWQDVYVELQEEGVLLYAMEAEETIDFLLCVMTWRSAQMKKMSPQRRMFLQEQNFLRSTTYHKIRKQRKQMRYASLGIR
jgi:hypothetical protein